LTKDAPAVEKVRINFRAGSPAALPRGRVGRPQEAAEAYLFAMTNGFLTGSVLDVDGGRLL
jgi:NAD(P)-dependent dehydrogenase (short-subunit alcohol dehydrogenase family)